MKSIILSALILCSTTAAFSQSIKLPAEKRDKYVTEPATKTEARPVSDRERQAEMDRQRKEKEQARERGASTLSQAKDDKYSTSAVFCSIREIGTTERQEGKVIIAIDPNMKKLADGLSDDKKKQLYAALEGHRFASGLEALNFFASNGWTLVETNIYSAKEQVVREYLLKLELK